MRQKTQRTVVTFHTTAEAMATERACKDAGLPGRLIPAPRAVTADCGIAWSAPPETREETETALACAGIEPAGIYDMVI